MSTSPHIPALSAGLPESRPAPVKLASERVTIAAPMSLAGSTARTRNVIERISGGTAKKVSLVTGLTLVLVMWWLLILCWYVFFGLWLVPYRLCRRGSAKARRGDAAAPRVSSLDGQPTAGRQCTAPAVSIKGEVERRRGSVTASSGTVESKPGGPTAPSRPVKPPRG